MRSLLLLAGVLAGLWWPPDRMAALPWCIGVATALCLLRPLRPGLLMVVGAAGAAWLATQVMRLPPVEAGTRLIVEAQIAEVPALDESGWQFAADIHFPRQPGWPSQRWRVRLPASMEEPRVGERWQLALRFDPPRDAGERRLLLRDRVSAQARMVDGKLNHRLQPAEPSLDGLRSRIARRITDRVADPAAGTLLAALAVGVTGEVSTRQWQVFNATGITHLVAISGMHVTFFAMLSMAAARRLWLRIATWPVAPRRESFTAAVGILMALLYALLSGFSVPAQRTVLMLAAFLISRECGRCCTPAWSVAVALTAVLLLDPLAPLGAGFWLSFLAVAAIVLLAGARLQEGAPLRDAVRLQWLVSIALLPATVVIFGSFSAVGLLANALAIPVFTFLLVPPVLLATAAYLLPWSSAGWCGDQLVDLCAWVAGWMWPFLSWCAALPGALWRADAPVTWLLLCVPAALLALLPVALHWRAVSLALLGSVFLLRDPRPEEGEVWLDVPDRGRSGAMLLRTRDHLLIWGTGESFGSRGRAFARHLQPLLRQGSHPAVDLWLPGNLTRDVQAALTLAAAHMPVHAVLLPPARTPPPEMQSCTPRQWNWNGIGFSLDEGPEGRSCMLALQAGDHDLRVGGRAASTLPEAQGATLQLVLDVTGIRQRRRHLGL